MSQQIQLRIFAIIIPSIYVQTHGDCLHTAKFKRFYACAIPPWLYPRSNDV